MLGKPTHYLYNKRAQYELDIRVGIDCHNNSRPLVDTKYGKLLGKTNSVKATDRQVHVFLGIPFAKPPVGELRFAPPQSPEPWSDIRDASQRPPMCIQSMASLDDLKKYFLGDFPPPRLSEDCLILNIYTPADRVQNSLLTVMVFIHGGAFIIGGANMFDGSALSAYENIVVVSIQYRLGILGFFSTGKKEAPGNYGYLDQVAALQWVQENIKDFGGDPLSVTLFGESAGAVSVAAQVVSPLSKGLFHRAITESGTAMMPAVFAKNQKELLIFQLLVAKASGCHLVPIVSCLKKKTAEELLEISNAMDFIPLPARVDGVLFPKLPEELWACKEVNDVALMTGVN
ncbi:Hypothetical predicted protein [Pelobates cultripes]|uniref:Carboxylic ester hydrolase n=1 Tax=Pelobates cultripes TaxID=61616 RepID=A0AAD1TD06_PELCU|nr:Hypothetical predicted protein [Pelobates cultripes]